ncbi:hypothetical protein SAMN05216548_108107 [Faunimonas pinastri]|uniref:Uncharacterized protein n=1 Tax=Faunimonas pinastri TaxID=1855383 RepID=A0A1H9JFQ5_9HYPH|nr:hypothetical protein [Faunimonas pinastri]SEQ85672.1 hypothetical protein SAMN05216548_108107 [Faunimonas pinastri]
MRMIGKPFALATLAALVCSAAVAPAWAGAAKEVPAQDSRIAHDWQRAKNRHMGHEVCWTDLVHTKTKAGWVAEKVKHCAPQG